MLQQRTPVGVNVDLSQEWGVFLHFIAVCGGVKWSCWRQTFNFGSKLLRGVNSVEKKKQQATLPKQMNKQTKKQTQIRNTTKQLTHKQTKKPPFPKDPCKVSMPSLVSFSNRKKPQTTQAKTQPETIHKKKY